MRVSNCEAPCGSGQNGTGVIAEQMESIPTVMMSLTPRRAPPIVHGKAMRAPTVIWARSNVHANAQPLKRIILNQASYTSY